MSTVGNKLFDGIEDDARDGTIMHYDLSKHDLDIEEVADDCS